MQGSPRHPPRGVTGLSNRERRTGGRPHPINIIRAVSPVKECFDQPGMVTWIQRFGSAANLNVHLHSVVFNGVFVEQEDGGAEWRGLPEPNKGDAVAAIAWDICMRVSRALKSRGLSLAGEGGDIDELAERESLLAA